MGKQWKQWLALFFWAPKSLQMVTAAMKLKDAFPWKESYDQPRQHIKKQRHYFANRGLSSQGYGFSSSHVTELNWTESHTVKGFGRVNKAEVDVFLELSCFFHDPADVGNLISGSSAFSKTSLNICKFMVHILLKPGLESFEHYFTSMWDECNCVVVWEFFGIAFLWDWDESGLFPVLRPLTAKFSKFSGILSVALS